MSGVSLSLAVAFLSLAASDVSSFKAGDEAIVYKYNTEAEQKDTISSHPVAVNWLAYQEVERAAADRNIPAYKEMEKRGDLFWVLSGTRCRVVDYQKGGTLGEIRSRDAYQVKFLNGDQKDKTGWLLANLLRRRPRIVIDPLEPITEENRDNPAFLALTIQAQDKVVYRELKAAQAKADAAARTLPRGNPKRQLRYEQVYQRELRPILQRYDLDESAASRILDWGKKGDWPVKEESKAAPAK